MILNLNLEDEFIKLNIKKYNFIRIDMIQIIKDILNNNITDNVKKYFDNNIDKDKLENYIILNKNYIDIIKNIL